jgi:group I intron endonuclease
MIGIYKITNPKGRVYIGQSVNIEKRFGEYRNFKNCNTQPKLIRSLKKYTISAHLFEIVEQCTPEELNTRERYWQDYYNVLTEGLNCRLTTTANKSGRMSQTSITRMSEASKKPVVQYTIQGTLIKEWNSGIEAGDKLDIHSTNIAACCRDKIKSAGGFVWRYREELLSTEIQVGKVGYSSTSEKLKKKVLQYNKQGEFVKEWESLTKVTESLGIRQGDISNCIAGKQRTAKGFIWKYKTTQEFGD